MGHIKLNIKSSTAYISILVIIIILFMGQSSAIVAYTDNNADSDSNIDSSANISNTGITDYTDAQSLDGTDQQIQEVNTGGPDTVDNDASNVDVVADVGTHSQFTNQQTKDGVFDTLTENLPSTNTYSLSSVATGYMIVGDGTPHWGVVQGTISYWIRFNDLSVSVRPWGLGGDFEMRMSGTKLQLDWGGVSLTSISTFTTDKWYFVAVTWNESNDTLKIYMGDESTSPVVDASSSTWTGVVAGQALVENNFLASRTIDAVNGFGDELRFYDTDRSTADIQSDYDRSIKGDEPNLRSYFKLDNDFIDSGPDGNDGYASGTTQFSTTTPSNYKEIDAELDLEVQWTSLPYTTADLQLSILTGNKSGENLNVEYWNGAGWTTLISSLTVDSWNNISVSSYVVSNTFTIRYRDASPTADKNSQDTWQIDVTLIQVTNYQLEWEHQVQLVDTTKEYYNLTIFGFSSNVSESFEIQLWNQSSSTWLVPLSTKIGITEQWYNMSISGNGAINSEITWRYRGDNEIKDTIQTTLNIDYAGVASYGLAPILVTTPTDIQFDEGQTGYNLVWNATDDNPDNYTIYKDGVPDGSGLWTNAGAITKNLDGLTKGVYNYKIVFEDQFGNTAFDIVDVTVLDNTNPTVNQPANIFFEASSTGNIIGWIGNDNYPDNYIVYRNGSQVGTSSWTSGVSIDYNIDGLLKGNYLFTVEFFDLSGNSITNDVYVNVFDTTNPVVDNPADVTYNEGTPSNTIDWTASDLHNSTYFIYKDGVQVDNGNWTSGVPVSINVDGLLKGSYSYKIQLFDTSGNYINDTVIVNVLDGTAPMISSPSDIQYEEESTGNTITWTISDNYPYTLTIYRDGSLLFSVPWTSGDMVINVDGLSLGTYNYTIEVIDKSNNISTDPVWVTVIDTVKPIITSPADFSTSFGSTGNVIEWIGTDINPSTYVITRNGTQVNSGSWLSSATISLNIDGLSLGPYNFTIVLSDISGNQVIDEVIIKVTSGPTLTEVPPDTFYVVDTTGNKLSWTGSNSNPDKYIIYNNTVEVASGSWSNGIPITIDIDGLSIGVYNFSIFMNDTDANYITHELNVTVSDMPLWAPGGKASNTTYVEGSGLQYVNWNTTDMFPANYSIYKDGSLVAFNSWDNSTYISLNITDYTLGFYEITIYVNDTVNNIISSTMWLNVTDTTIPTISTPLDVTFDEGSTGNTVVWTATDNYAATYEIRFANGTLFDSGAWVSGVPISYNLDAWQWGTYTITITVIDSSGNSDTDTVLITVNDGTDPIITSNPIDFSFTEGSLSNTVEWTATDKYNSTYEIRFSNGTLITSGNWDSGVAVSYNLDSWPKGVYTVTMTFFDLSGNSIADSVQITVTDDDAPILTDTPTDITFSEGTTGNFANWTATDNYNSTYELKFFNGTLISSDNWESGVVISYNLDAWLKGTYFVTMTIFDASGNSVVDNLQITINDNTNPLITSNPTDFSFPEGSTGNFANWTATDNYNTTYEIRFANATLIENGNWDSGVEISLNVDSWNYGVYDVTITYNDASGNSASDSVIITVTDVDPPVIISNPTDFSFSEGSTGNTVTWTATDSYSSTYEIRFVNTTLIDSGTWSSGVAIVYNLDSWSMGVYTVIITVFDLSTNTDTDTVLITVIDTTSPSVTNPQDVEYFEEDTSNTISWTPSDLYPSNYTIYNNSIVIDTGIWTDGTPIVINVDGLSIGTYNFTLYLNDTSGNTFTDLVWVQVLEKLAPSFVVTPPLDVTFEAGTTGNTIDWSAFDIYNDTYIIYQNGTPSSPINWNNNDLISIDLDFLSLGVYNFTLVILDSSNNQLVHTVIVTVNDSTAPVILNDSGDLTYGSGSLGNVIFWNATDINTGIYDLSKDGIQIITGAAWPDDGPIYKNVDNLAVGSYTYFIEIYDKAGNMVSNTIIVTVVDGVNPLNTDRPLNRTISEGSTGNILSWTYEDINADTYVIKRDGVTVQPSSPWISNTEIQFSISDFIKKGLYNYTIYVYDTSGNVGINSTIIIVIDDTIPILTTSPDLTQYVEESTGNILVWTATDEYASYYDLIIDGVNDSSSPVNWNTNIANQINIDGLSTGTYNYTIYFYDESGNYVSSSYIITVKDLINPVFVSNTQPGEYIEGNSNYNLTWNVYDTHPSWYNFSRNGEIILSTSWVGSEIILDIDGLSAGDYNFTITIFDESLNNATHSVLVSVKDILEPTFQSVPEGFTYILGTAGNTLTYTAFDLHPQSYVLYVDGIVWETNIWENNEAIIINIDDFDVKYYNFTIEIFDESRNSVQYSLIVRVKDPNVIDTQRPEIILQETVFEGDLEAIEGTWLTIDNDTIVDAVVTYEIFLQAKVASYTATTDQFGNYTLLFNYDELLPGTYYWIVHFEKDGYQPWDDIIIEIEVLPHTFNIDLSAPENLVQGEEYFISAILYYGNGSSSEVLSLSEFISNLGTVEGVEVVFVIIVLDKDGNPTQYTKRATSNSQGVALISLDGSETQNIVSIESIGVSIGEDVGFLEVAVSMPVDDFPTISAGEPGPLTKALELLQANVLPIVVIIIIVVATLLVLFWYRKQQGERIKQINESIKIATEELAAVKSIQSIIIQTSTKLTIYEENVVPDAMNTNLIGGMITAFSSFLNEIGRSELFGFEMMEREDVSLTVHKGKYSNFIVISTEKLPMIILSQIQAAQKTLEDTFKDNFVNTARGVRKLIKSQVHPQFTKASFKIPLTQTLKLNTGNINKVMKEKSVSRALKQTVTLLNELDESQYSPDGLFDLEKVSAFFESRDISSKLSSRTIMLAYEFHIIEVVPEE